MLCWEVVRCAEAELKLATQLYIPESSPTLRPATVRVERNTLLLVGTTGAIVNLPPLVMATPPLDHVTVASTGVSTALLMATSQLRVLVVPAWKIPDVAASSVTVGCGTKGEKGALGQV